MPRILRFAQSSPPVELVVVIPASYFYLDGNITHGSYRVPEKHVTINVVKFKFSPFPEELWENEHIPFAVVKHVGTDGNLVYLSDYGRDGKRIISREGAEHCRPFPAMMPFFPDDQSK